MLRRAREHRASLIDQHRQRPRRIDESHHRNLHRRDEEENHDRDQNPFPAATKFPFVSSRRGHLPQETARATRAQLVVMRGSLMLVPGLALLLADGFTGMIPEPTGTTGVATN